jgi:hypothetical protein
MPFAAFPPQWQRLSYHLVLLFPLSFPLRSLFERIAESNEYLPTNVVWAANNVGSVENNLCLLELHLIISVGYKDILIWHGFCIINYEEVKRRKHELGRETEYRKHNGFSAIKLEG